MKKTKAQQLGITTFPYFEYDENGNRAYIEWSNNHWHKKEYNDKGNEIYWESSTGFWLRYKYDDKGNRIYTEYDDGEKIYTIR